MQGNQSIKKWFFSQELQQKKSTEKSYKSLKYNNLVVFIEKMMKILKK